MIDEREASRFLRALCGRDDPPVTWQTFSDLPEGTTPRKPDPLARTLHGTLAQHGATLRRLNEAGDAVAKAGVFVCINATDLQGVSYSNVIAPRALWVDDDQGTVDVARLPIAPSIVIQSGGKLPDGRPRIHVYWLLKPDEPLAAFKEAQHALIAALGTDKAINNPNRVMRVPGFVHNKYAPNPTRIETIEDRKYTIAEVLAAFGATKGAQQTPTFTVGTTAPASAGGNPIAGATVRRTLTMNGLNGAVRHAPSVGGASPAQTVSGERVRGWLVRRRVQFREDPPYVFNLAVCPLNPMHGASSRIRVETSGALFAQCWHASDGGNQQSWPRFKVAIGDWDQRDPSGFVRGDHVEVGRRLAADLRLGSQADTVAVDGRIWRYNDVSGLWESVDQDEVDRLIMEYAGKPIGDAGKVLALKQSDIRGIGATAKQISGNATFFREAPTGVAFTNGFLVIDAREVRLETPSPHFRARIGVPYDYDLAAPAPRWLRFLDEIFAPDADREEKIAVIQEFIGACLLGIATRFEAALIFSGAGSNGKSRALRVFQELFPPHVRAAVKPQEMHDLYMRARLVGIRLNSLSELPETDILESEAFKAIVSGDAIEARSPYKEPFTYAPIAGHLFAANRLPATADHSHGFWRKVIVVALNRRWEDNDPTRDPLVADKIIATEMPGVAAWAIRGGQRLLENNHYTIPASSEAAKQAWRRKSDPVQLFIEECCEASTVVAIGARELYNHFTMWTRVTGHKQMAEPKFKERMQTLGYMPTRTARGSVYGLAVVNAPFMGGFLSS